MSEALETGFKRLHLADARRVWRDLVRRAETESWSYEHFLETLVREEIAQRRQTRIQRAVNAAAFPFVKTVEEFDFSLQSAVRLTTIGSLLAPDFVTEGDARHPLRKAWTRKDAPRRLDRVPGHPERLRRALRHRRGPHRRALVREPRRRASGRAREVHQACGPRGRRGGLPLLRGRPRRTCSSTSSTSGTPAVARWSSRPTSPRRSGATSCTTLTSRRLSSTASSMPGRLLKLDGPSMRTRHVPQADLEDDTEPGPLRVSGTHTGRLLETRIDERSPLAHGRRLLPGQGDLLASRLLPISLDSSVGRHRSRRSALLPMCPIRPPRLDLASPGPSR